MRRILTLFVISRALLVVLRCAGRRCKVADRGHFLAVPHNVRGRRGLCEVRHGKDVLGSRVIRLVQSSRIGKELLEVLKKICGVVEQVRNLGINVLDGLRVPLISLENFKELFVDLWFILEPVLRI